MDRLKVLKKAVIIGTILGITTFGTVLGYAQEGTGVSKSSGQDMHGMEASSQETEMKMTSSQETEMKMSTENESEMDMHNSSDTEKTEAKTEMAQDEMNETGAGHGESKEEEPVPWGFIYGFLAVNGAMVLTAGVVKVTKQRTVPEI